MQRQAIICVGNRLHEGDSLGGLVYDALMAQGDVQAVADVVDGGLGGIDLLREIEPRRRVVFVDALDEISFPGGISVLCRGDVAALATGYGHGAGLPYLFSLLPKLVEDPPEVLLLGAAGPATPSLVQDVVNRCLMLVADGSNRPS
jgi:hydrogenase maturation protease